MIGKGRAGLQRQAARRNGFTLARRTRFLEVLAETCNVRASATAIGKDPATAQRLRRKDPEFARLWHEAIAQGQERLHQELLAHALGQLPSRDNPASIEAPTTPIPFDPQVAIKVLQLQAGRERAVQRRGDAPAQADIDAALLERLEALAERLARP